MALFLSQEDRPLKKSRLGPYGPEVYPQDRKQKEDELTTVNVKHGFNNASTIRDEYGSAKDNAINSAKVTASFNAILAKKHEYNAFNDQSKKKQILNTKDNFYPAGIPPRGKQFLEAWFKDLAGHKPLLLLAKKVPIYNKKEEILQKLCEENVPLSRSAWLIKMTNAYCTAISEATKSKKRQAMDPFLEWTQVITRCLKEQLQKILDHYQGAGAHSGFLTAGSASAQTVEAATKQWNFGTLLAQHMYDEGLLDRQEYLTWLVELLEKGRITDHTVLKLVIVQVVRFTSEFVHSNLLSRKLAHFCAKKISQLCTEAAGASPCAHAPSVASAAASETSVPATVSSGQNSLNNFSSLFSDYCNCFQHRSLLINLTAIVQSVTLANPSAMVWHNLGEGKSASALSGSPLDLLPCPPSALPMPASNENRAIRHQLKTSEEKIVTRSRAVETKWSSDKRQQSATGAKITSVLGALDALDRHNFERAETSNPLDILYQKIFGTSLNQASKDNGSDGFIIDEPVVNVLCEWSVSTSRSGEHRAIVVACLLEKYQNDLLSDRNTDGDTGDDRDSNASDVVISGTPPFQSLLLQFLDDKAPILEDERCATSRQAFANLIQLFCQLIQHDVFSHDAYICTLISRGDLQTASALNAAVSAYGNPYHSDAASIKSEVGTGKVETHEEIKMELDCQNLHDADFGAFAFKEESKASPDIRQPGSMHGLVEQSVLSVGSVNTIQALTPLGSGSMAASGGTYMGSGIARTPSGAGPLTPRSSRTPGPHTPGNAHTPGGAGGGTTPGSVHSSTTPGMYHTMAHTPGIAHTPASVSGTQSGINTLTASSDSRRSVAQLFKGHSRHLLFATHFPISSADSSSHESNQRMVVLYGVGKKRDEARHIVKKATKEIGKLIGKKSCIDVVLGEIAKGKKKKDKENEIAGLSCYESTFSRFRKLSYHDMHSLTNTVSQSLVESISTFATGSSSCVPVIDNVSHLFDLMEYCLNVGRLLEVCVQLLKDMPDVESQLVSKSSILVGTYTTKLCLCIVGVLRKYHACLLISQEQTASVFESLCKVVKHIDKPSDCTSAERSILAYLYDLYTSCGYIKLRFADMFSGPSVKVKNTLYVSIEPSSSNRLWEEQFAKDLIDNPKGKIDSLFIRQLNECVTNRYSFVCSALVNVCNCPSVERLNDIAILCAELTACCNALSSEWLGVLKALCWSSNHNCGFIDVLTQVDVGDFSIHDSLAVFTAILIARHCFTLEDLVGHVALQSLLAACPSVGSGGDPDAEMGARLTCHLLLRLFQMMNAVPGGSSILDVRNKGTMYVKASWDRHLLEAAHKRINVGAVVAVLKAILMLGDSCHAVDGLKDSLASKKDTMGDDIISSMLSSLDDDDDDLGSMRLIGVGGLQGGSKGRVESAGLSDYGKHCLHQICTQEWVREKFLQEPEQLFSADLLLDKMLSHQQAQHLVQMICYQGNPPNRPRKSEDDESEDEESEQKKHISRILKNMNQWTQRTSWLELQLMIKQASPNEMTSLLDNIAKGTIEVFRRQTDRKLCGNVEDTEDSLSVWLIAPLISRLAGNVQGRVLKTAGQFLETGNQFWTAKNSKDRERYLQKSTALLGNQSFLSLVLTCLRGQDEQRESLLKSLHDQLEKFVLNAKELQDRVMPTDDRLQTLMHDALHLRLSLVGNMFDMIQRSNTLTQDWAILLAQLVSSGVVDVHGNADLFTVVSDMLDVLVHGTLACSDVPEKGEDNKKVYQSLIRKLKKELGERKSASIDLVRRLLPLSKVLSEITVCEPHSGDSRGGHKPNEASSCDRRQGLQIVRKEKVSPWEILEGHKNTAPLSLSSFCAVRIERKPLKYEEQHRLLLYHGHSLKRPANYYLEPPQVPPEVLEPQTEAEDNNKMLEPMQENKHSSELRVKAKKQRSNSKDQRSRMPQGIRPTLTIAGPQMAAPYMQSNQSPGGGFVRTPDMYLPQGSGNTGVPGGWPANAFQQPAVGRGVGANYQNQLGMTPNPRHQLLMMKAARGSNPAYMSAAAGGPGWISGRQRPAGMMRTAGGGGSRAMLESGMYAQQPMIGYGGSNMASGQGYGSGYSSSSAAQSMPGGPSSALMDQVPGGVPQSFSQASFQGGAGGSGGVSMGMQGKPGSGSASMYNMHGSVTGLHQNQMGSSHSRYNTIGGMAGMSMGVGGGMMNLPPRYNQIQQAAAVRQSLAAGGAAYTQQQQQHEQQQRQAAAAAVRQQQIALQQQQMQQQHLQQQQLQQQHLQQQQMQLLQQQHQGGAASMMMQKQLSSAGVAQQQQQQTGQQFLHRY